MGILVLLIGGMPLLMRQMLLQRQRIIHWQVLKCSDCNSNYRYWAFLNGDHREWLSFNVLPIWCIMKSMCFGSVSSSDNLNTYVQIESRYWFVSMANKAKCHLLVKYSTMLELMLRWNTFLNYLEWSFFNSIVDEDMMPRWCVQGIQVSNSDLTVSANMRICWLIINCLSEYWEGLVNGSGQVAQYVVFQNWLR